MGLGRPADPEHIGDTFLWMKRNEKLDHLSLESFPGPFDDGESDCFGLVPGEGARGPVWPGADIQLP
jgi:hypothetical protein